MIELVTVYKWTYAELIALGTPSFIAFGVFSLPAGWLGDRWSRPRVQRNLHVRMVRESAIVSKCNDSTILAKLNVFRASPV